MESEKNQIITNNKINYSTPIAIVLAGIIIAGALYFSDSKKAVAPDTSSNNQKLTVDIKNVKTDGEPFIGNPTAPITVAVWFDYLCGACKYNEQNILSPLVSDYVKTGKLKIIFKDFAFLSPQSQAIAIAGRAVWEAYPEKFYEWHKFMFENQGKIVSPTDFVGIDKKVVEKLIAEKGASYQNAIDENKSEGVRFGVNATPSMIISDQLIVGVPQYVELKSFIDNLLKNS